VLLKDYFILEGSFLWMPHSSHDVMRFSHYLRKMFRQDNILYWARRICSGSQGSVTGASGWIAGAGWTGLAE
jgi:hypothetical protein